MTAEDELAQAKKKIAQLEKEIEKLKQGGEGAAGWLITTPNSAFSGQTMNVQFRKGCAFVPDAMDGERIARMMQSEFNYSIQHVENYADIPADSPVRRAMIDMLMIPQQV